MLKTARITAVLFLAVFAASSVMHSVRANSMPLDMALASGGEAAMPDCQDCAPGADAGGNGAACPQGSAPEPFPPRTSI